VKLYNFLNFRNHLAFLLATTLGVSLAACSYKNGYEPAPCNLPAVVSYKADVLPILQQNCYRCHNAANYQIMTKNTFNMEAFAKVQYYASPANGINGTSFLIGNIRHDSGFVPMPYDGGKLNDCQIATIKAWADAGALDN
jgi:hypothetical protein